MSDEEGVPEDRCGFVLEPGDVGGDIAERYDAGSERWYENSEAACCWREAWDGEDTGRCIWHSEVDDKPVEALTEARAANSEWLDGAYLQETKLNDAISFDDCRMWAVDLRGAIVGEGVFRNADLRNASLVDTFLEGSILKNANLNNANLKRANLRSSNLSGANLINIKARDAILEGTDLERVDLTHSHLDGVNFAHSNLADANLPAVDLTATDFWCANLEKAVLWGADLDNANLDFTNLRRTSLKNADLGNAIIENADLVGADLTDADLTDTNLRNADLKAATLEDAILTRTDIRGADFEYAELYQTLFSNVQMNNRTEFGELCQYEVRDARPQNDDEDSDVSPLEAAAWTYRRIQTLHEENALAQDARQFHVRKAEAYRKLRWREFAEIWSRPHRDPTEWALAFVRSATYSINRWLSRHGESPHRVVGVSLGVIGLSTLAYPSFGIRSTEFADGPRMLTYAPAPVADATALPTITDLTTVLGKSLYFSVVTFTTVGYGDLQPVGFAQLLATIESFAGALLMALLVFVLGRRATW